MRRQLANRKLVELRRSRDQWRPHARRGKRSNASQTRREKRGSSSGCSQVSHRKREVSSSRSSSRRSRVAASRTIELQEKAQARDRCLGAREMTKMAQADAYSQSRETWDRMQASFPPSGSSPLHCDVRLDVTRCTGELDIFVSN